MALLPNVNQSLSIQLICSKSINGMTVQTLKWLTLSCHGFWHGIALMKKAPSMTKQMFLCSRCSRRASKVWRLRPLIPLLWNTILILTLPMLNWMYSPCGQPGLLVSSHSPWLLLRMPLKLQVSWHIQLTNPVRTKLSGPASLVVRALKFSQPNWMS